MCRSKTTKMYAPRQIVQPHNWVEETVDDQALFHIADTPSRPFTVDLCIEGNMLTFKVDTGAAVTLISEATYQKHYAARLQQELIEFGGRGSM